MVLTAPWCQHCRELMSTQLRRPRGRRAGPGRVRAGARRRRAAPRRQPALRHRRVADDRVADDRRRADRPRQLPRRRRAASTASSASATRGSTDKDDIQRRIGELWAQADERTTARRREAAPRDGGRHHRGDLREVRPPARRLRRRHQVPPPRGARFRAGAGAEARRRAHARGRHADARPHDGEPAARRHRRRLLPLLADGRLAPPELREAARPERARAARLPRGLPGVRQARLPQDRRGHRASWMLST